MSLLLMRTFTGKRFVETCQFKPCAARKGLRWVYRDMLLPELQDHYDLTRYRACQKHFSRVYRYGDPYKVNPRGRKKA